MTDPRAIVLAGAEKHDLATLAGYREVGGYEQLVRVRRLEPEQVLDELFASNLRGRGGPASRWGARRASSPRAPDGRPSSP
ncbi:MAG TPA: hypothetical protein VGF23_11530 [Gaiellaceae bacterium]